MIGDTQVITVRGYDLNVVFSPFKIKYCIFILLQEMFVMMLETVHGNKSDFFSIFVFFYKSNFSVLVFEQ